jgi:diguanylate cyclase (GGDEF)-like protein/PAS domain S-box-containing protein
VTAARNEDGRLAALEATGLLDSQAEPAFDRITRLAATLLGAPVALISLVDARREFFKSTIGLTGPWASTRQTPLTHSLCRHVTWDRVPLVVADARLHPLLRDSLAIRDLGAVAYAGVPLIIDGQAVGALCVIDHQPREWLADQVSILSDLASAAVSEIQLRTALRATRDARAITDAVIESIGDACMAVDNNRRFLVVNQAARQVFATGAKAGELLPDDWSALHQSRRADGSTLPSEEGPLGRGLLGRQTDDLTFTLHKPGEPSIMWVEASGRPVRDAEGKVIAAVAIYRDVTNRMREATELHQTRHSLSREQELLRTTLAHIADGVALIDAESRILIANQSFCAMLGLPMARVVGLTREGFAQHVTPLLADPTGFRTTLDAQPRDVCQDFVFARPRPRILARSWTPVRLAEADGLLVTWHDVTAERDLFREREQLLLVDALTGIPNRRAGDLALRTECERMKRMGTPLSVGLLDIDHFKRVNDVFGHAVGDEVLRAVASTLAGQGRLTDTVVRWGGEEFLAVLNVHVDGARTFCERLRRAVERLECPPVERITISVGVSELAPAEPLAEALARADKLLYEAKTAGRNRVIAQV